MKKRIYTKPIGIMVSEEMYSEIFEISEQNDWSLSEYIRGSIELRLVQESDKENYKNKQKHKK